MKTRNGFVSNSLSSSFVIAGVRIAESSVSEELWEELCDSYDCFYPGEGGAPSGCYLVGKEIADSEEWGLNESETSMAEVSSIISDIVDKMEDNDIPVISTGIMCGTRAS